jgi:hypothetical protein
VGRVSYSPRDAGWAWRGEQWVCARHSHVDIEQYGLADPFNLRNDAFEVERLCEHNFEDLLHVDGRGCRAKDERRVHRLGKSLGLLCDLLLFVARECRKGIKLGSDEKGYRSLHVSCQKSGESRCMRWDGKRTLLNPRA